LHPAKLDPLSATLQPGKEAGAGAAKTQVRKPAIERLQSPAPAGRKEAAKPAFEVQVGAFRSEDNAAKLINQLSERGYSPFLVRTRDSNQRLWFLVRMGHYEDRDRASAAAGEFLRRENRPAIARPAGAL
jgi:cell division septation protein DedD